MKRKRSGLAGMATACLLLGGVALAQYGWDREFRRDFDRDTLPADRAGVPDWQVDLHFKHDVFTFVRVQYDSVGRRRGWGRGGGGWRTDFPDSDLNFPFRLQQLTSMKVDPQPIILRLTDARLFDYPFLYMIEPGALYFSDEEVVCLRRYLLNGGFLMVDDFWGDYEYQNFYEQIKRVFPEFEPVELEIDHEIFQCVYKLKEKPQVPAINTYQSYGPDVTWEPRHGGDSQTVHYRAISDKKNRMMVIICHNTDLGDGWEQEGADPGYFREYAEKKSYPMGINIVTYAMTH